MTNVKWTLLLVLTVAGAVSGQQDGQPLFHAGRTELVVLPVLVSDHKGAYVQDLSQQHFLVYDDKRIQPITYFTHADAPVSVALVIDSSASMGRKLAEVRVATHRFAVLSHPEDELLIYAFNDSVHETFGGEPIPAGAATELEAALSALHAEGRTALYDGVASALDAVDHRPLSRKVVIVMSDGGDNASAAKLPDVLERARRSSVTIYTIGLFDPVDPDANAGVLESLADTTGGRRFLPRSPGPLLQACEQIAREIRSAYTLSYVPPDRDARYHHVEVRASRGDGEHLAVRTRPGYMAAAPTR
jgi:Ca-activated chloride channel family protein